MAIIRVLGLKGGVGKSVISAYLSKYLAERGNKVILIDRDNIGFSSVVLKLSNAKDVEVTRESNFKSLSLSDYHYVVVDCPTLIKPELISTCLINVDPDNITILVSDVFSLNYVSEFTKDIEGNRVLIVNMVSPFPEDIQAVASKVKDLDFDLKVVIPFIPKLFVNITRNLKGTEIEILRKLSEVIEKKDFKGQVILPFDR